MAFLGLLRKWQASEKRMMKARRTRKTKDQSPPTPANVHGSQDAAHRQAATKAHCHPIDAASVHISRTFSKTMLECRSNALTRAKILRLLRQLIRTCAHHESAKGEKQNAKLSAHWIRMVKTQSKAQLRGKWWRGRPRSNLPFAHHKRCANDDP